MTQQRPFVSTAVFTLFGRALGLVIPFFIAMIYGAGRLTDAFFFAYVVILYLVALFTHIFESALIPYLVERKKAPGEVASFSNAILLVSFGPACLIGLLLWRYLESFLTRWGGWDAESAYRVSRIFFEMLPVFILGVIVAAHNGVFYTYKIFWWPSLSPMVRSLMVLVFIFTLNKPLGIHALTGGFSFGELLRWGITLILLLRLTPWSWKIRWREAVSGILDFIHQVFFQILALIAFNSVFLVGQFFALRLEAGSLTLLNYADRLIQIPYIFFMAGFLQVFLTDWSDNYYDESLSAAPAFWSKINRDIRWGFLTSLGLGGVLWFLRYFIVGMVYGRGELSSEQLRILSDLFGWLAVGFVFGVVRLLYGRILFVMKKAKFYCLQCWVEFLLNVALTVVLMRFFGVVGIAMATAVVYAFISLWSHWYFKHYDPAVRIAADPKSA